MSPVDAINIRHVVFLFKFPRLYNPHCTLFRAAYEPNGQHALRTQLTKQQKTHKSVKERKTRLCMCKGKVRMSTSA